MGRPPTIVHAEAVSEAQIHHPLNPRSGMGHRSLSDAAGLERLGFHLVRLPPGKEANELHTHRFEEEFYYVIEGRGLLLVGDDRHEVGPGSFAGFPAPSPAHLMTNPFDEDLVYLIGGERRQFEIAEFPRHAKILFRAGADVYMADAGAVETLRLDMDD